MTFDRMMVRTILEKFIFTKSDNKVSSNLQMQKVRYVVCFAILDLYIYIFSHYLSFYTIFSETIGLEEPLSTSCYYVQTWACLDASDSIIPSGDGYDQSILQSNFLKVFSVKTQEQEFS